MRRLRWALSIWLVLIGMGAAQAPIASVGPTIGSNAPAFSAVDQFGRTRTLESLLGRDGLMLVFFRSADW
jgi:hypothetical protein